MGLTFIRPVVPEGQIGGSNWMGSVQKAIDARLLADNFRSLYATWNGNLHATNFDPQSMQSTIGEYQIHFRENLASGITIGDPPASGLSHSHNGTDSSYLAPGSVDMDVTKHRSFGAMMCPSTTKGMVVMHGVADVVLSPGRVQTFYIDVPYDDPVAGSGVGSSGIGRSAAQLELSDPGLLGNKVGLPISYLYAESGGWLYLQVNMYVSSSVPVGSEARIHWAVYFLR